MLIAASLIIIGVGCAHSWLGEHKVLIPLYNRYALKPATERVIRISWHLITLFWIAIAAQLAAMQFIPEHSNQSFLLIMAVCFAISTVIALVSSRGRHISWIGFGMATIFLSNALYQM